MSIDPQHIQQQNRAVKANCSHCRGERNCEIRGHFHKSDGDDDFSWQVDWYILQCRGCDTVFARTVSTNSEDYENYYEHDGSTGTTYNETVSYWPALTKRNYPEWMTEVGIDADQVGKLNEALLELYTALNSDLYILAGIGLRTSFDVAACLFENIEENMSFQEKLDSLEKDGKIKSQDKVRLATLIEVGNASAHRGWKPTAEYLNTMMDVLESFIYETFVVPTQKARVHAKVVAIDGQVPRRQRKKANAVAEPLDFPHVPNAI